MAHLEDRWARPERKGQGKRWRARYLAPDGRERSQSFDKKVDAERFLATVQADVLRGAYVDPRAGQLRFKGYAESWLAGRLHLRKTSYLMYEAHLKNHIVPAFGTAPLAGIRRSDVQAFVSSLAAPGKLQPGTVRTVYAVLRGIMVAAVADELIVRTPCDRIALPQLVHRDVKPLEPAEVIAVAQKMPAWLELSVWLGATAGLREGEALGLALDRVDFLGRRIRVDQQAQSYNGAPPVLVPPKTASSRRTIPVDPGLTDRIAAHVERFGQHPTGLILRNRLGDPVRRSGFAMTWGRAVEQAGLPKGTRFHDLRHTYASTLISTGRHPKVIQARLGHSSITETMDTYGHLFPDSEDLGRGDVDAIYQAAEEATTAQRRPEGKAAGNE